MTGPSAPDTFACFAATGCNMPRIPAGTQGHEQPPWYHFCGKDQDRSAVPERLADVSHAEMHLLSMLFPARSTTRMSQGKCTGACLNLAACPQGLTPVAVSVITAHHGRPVTCCTASKPCMRLGRSPPEPSLSAAAPAAAAMASLLGSRLASGSDS